MTEGWGFDDERGVKLIRGFDFSISEDDVTIAGDGTHRWPGVLVAHLLHTQAWVSHTSAYPTERVCPEGGCGRAILGSL